MLSAYQYVMQRIITSDEYWVYAYDQETDHQSAEYRGEVAPKTKKTRQSKSKIKIILTVFLDYRGVVHSALLPIVQTVNKEYYLSVIRHLLETIRKKKPELGTENFWFLPHDNAPSHIALFLHELSSKFSTNIVPQPPSY
ncbi:PREDICTED: histone-lysine N-methyltransferase SETMAR-like [Bactrocera latifrons]|uniref:histone-lysine N-methyltransferase SETMAR-like n=1 Tax=Bactrocera latifrons TaxID=174628 RepID=UPI0008DE59D2|nr:PREDICTED: histone-lysine N-methyltransferase SETMAR-like [Bactrocera latifrons]